MSNTILLARGHTDSVTTLTLSERLLTSGGDDGNIYLWSLEDSPFPVMQAPRMGPCSAAKFDPGNADVLYTAHDKYIYSWDLRSLNAFVNEWNVNEDEVNSIDVLGTEPRLASADDSGTVHIIDTAHGHIVRTLKKHDNICSVAKFRPGRSWQLISGGLDCRVIVSDWKGTGLGVIIFELNEIIAPPFLGVPRSTIYQPEHSNRGSSDSHASTSEYAEIAYDEFEDSDQETEEDDNDSGRRSPQGFAYVTSDRRSPQDARSYFPISQTRASTTPSELSTSHPESESWEPSTNQTTSISAIDAWGSGLPVNPPMVHSIACSTSGDLVAAGLERNTIELFAGDGKRLTHLKSLFGHRRAVSTLHFLEDNYLISGGNDCNLFLWTTGFDTEGQRISHDAKINAIEGRELQRMYIADYSPVIRLLDMSVC